MEFLLMLEGDQFEWLRHMIEAVPNAHRLRIAIDAGQLKLKVNEHSWTPPLGEAITGQGAQ